MNKIVLLSNPYRDKGLKTARWAENILNAAGVGTSLCLTSYGRNDDSVPQDKELGELNEQLEHADMLISFGGDGTILHAAKAANARKTPLLGVNLGSVGFLAELEKNELEQLERIAKGEYFLEERMMLDVKIKRDGEVIYSNTALNDILLIKAASAGILDLSVWGDDVVMSRFVGDGVILSTPTGSTAYSMSAGGPVVEPTAENIIMTPVCPHGIHARAFVLAPNRMVTVQLVKKAGRRRTALISVDGGRTIRMTDKDTLVVTRSEEKTNLVRLYDRKFYDTFRLKFGKERIV